jgi:alpha-beta hydrolase superfamily lysophospholipase
MKEKRARSKLSIVIRWILWVLLVQFILINISASLNAYRLTHFYEDPPAVKPDLRQNIFAKTWRLFTGSKVFKSKLTDIPAFPYKVIELRTTKGISIEAWHNADTLLKGTVILFHGVSSNKGMILDEANEFRRIGYNVMLVDFRGHGNSSGSVTTMGIRESEDVKLVYDYISKKGEKNILLWGVSMGAVAVTKAINDYGLQPSGVILELPVASLYSYIKAKAKTLGFPRQPFGFFVTLWAGIEGGYNGFNYKTANYAKKINCPVLMQAAALDIFVSKKETKEIFQSIHSSDKKLITYDEAGHEFLLKNDPVKWRSEVEEFLGKIH